MKKLFVVVASCIVGALISQETVYLKESTNQGSWCAQAKKRLASDPKGTALRKKLIDLAREFEQDVDEIGRRIETFMKDHPANQHPSAYEAVHVLSNFTQTGSLILQPTTRFLRKLEQILLEHPGAEAYLRDLNGMLSPEFFHLLLLSGAIQHEGPSEEAQAQLRELVSSIRAKIVGCRECLEHN